MLSHPVCAEPSSVCCAVTLSCSLQELSGERLIRAVLDREFGMPLSGVLSPPIWCAEFAFAGSADCDCGWASRAHDGKVSTTNQPAAHLPSAAAHLPSAAAHCHLQLLTCHLQLLTCHLQLLTAICSCSLAICSCSLAIWSCSLAICRGEVCSCGNEHVIPYSKHHHIHKLCPLLQSNQIKASSIMFLDDNQVC